MPNHTPPQLFLIDGYALIYRAFFAMIARPLRTTKGENTSAAWGVVNFLLRLREKYRPDYVVWINDAGTSFREQRYAEYKSTREKLDDSLQADFDRAVERIRALLEAFRIPLVAVRGYEADDVIGTLATAGAARGLQAVIVSGDKDFYQLIGPGVTLLNPGRGGPAAVDEMWVDESNGSERLGVPPHQVVDFLALVGDTSDNIPGVKGIGEKGAQKLLADYGDLDTILARAGEITAKRTREALLSQADNARLSRSSSPSSAMCRSSSTWTIWSSASRTVTRSSASSPSSSSSPWPSASAARSREKRPRAIPGSDGIASRGARSPLLPMTRARWRLWQMPTAGQVATATLPATAADWHALDEHPALEVSVLDDPDDLPALVARLRAAPLVGLDAETSSLEPHEAELVGLSLAAGPTEVWYLPFGHRPAAGELAAPAPVRNLPPLTDFALAPLVALLEDPVGPEGRAQHQVRLAGPPARRGRVGRGGLRFDARELRPRPRPTLARHRHALARAFRPADADLRRPHRSGQGADLLRRGAGACRRGILRHRQRDGAGAARLLRAGAPGHRDGATPARHRAAARGGADGHGVGGHLHRSRRLFRA